MEHPITWLHLSDFHVGKDDYAGRKLFEYILAHVQERKSLGCVPDFVFITGDIANHGQETEYMDFFNEFVGPISDIIGHDIDNRIFVVPGNHDVDRSKNQPFDREEMGDPSNQYFDPTLGSLERRRLLVPRFQAFIDADISSMSREFSGIEGLYSRTIEIRSHSVGIIGINTAWLSKDEYDEAKLTPGKFLVEGALESLKNTDVRIVLGHHPVDYIRSDQRQEIRSLFGRSSVIYLHGHLHHHWADPTSGGGLPYLAVQTGAGFQSRNGEIWQNGLLWGQLTLDTQILKLQPLQWTSIHHNWSLVGNAFPDNHRTDDWWVYPLPSSDDLRSGAKRRGFTPPVPAGWAIVDPASVLEDARPLQEMAAIHFFNGAVPSWDVVLSPSIPRRAIVPKIVESFADTDDVDRPIVTLLLAAACEGKSTALLQSASEIVRSKEGWKILQRVDDGAAFDVSAILRILDQDGSWLIVMDEADGVADKLLELLQSLPAAKRGQVHALMACRDTDWITRKAADYPWVTTSVFRQLSMSGLQIEECQAIVDAWSIYGRDGLGELLRVPPADRAHQLLKDAEDEAISTTSSAAFFGALLKARLGDDLRNHVRVLLSHLEGRGIPGGGDLLGALAFIAVMHVEQLLFLSRPVLAKALGCPTVRLHRNVIAPLGAEAAATSTSSFILTRHHRIAKAIADVLESEYGEDLGNLVLSLVKAALDVEIDGEEYVPKLGTWRYAVADHFMNTGRTELAINVARTVVKSEPTNAGLVVHLSGLYRRAGDPERASVLLRHSDVTFLVDRIFFFEWAVCESAIGKESEAVLLTAFSVSDQCSERRSSGFDSMYACVALSHHLSVMYKYSSADVIRDAQRATLLLGQGSPSSESDSTSLRIPHHEAVAERDHPFDIEQCIRYLGAALKWIESSGVDAEVAERLPQMADLTFGGLRQLVEGRDGR